MILTARDRIATAREAKEYNDLMLELSGISGRTPRFLTAKQIDRIREAQGLPTREKERRVQWQRYLDLTEALTRQLFATRRAIDIALGKSADRIKAAQGVVEEIRSRATVDGKGRRVYRTADRQRAFTDDGEELTREEIAAIQWNPHAPTWEQRQEAGERLKAAQQEYESILRAKERADYYADCMNPGDPLTPEELETIRNDLAAMPEAVKAEREADRAAAGARMQAARTSDLTDEFTLSAAEIASIKPAPGPTPEFRSQP